MKKLLFILILALCKQTHAVQHEDINFNEFSLLNKIVDVIEKENPIKINYKIKDFSPKNKPIHANSINRGNYCEINIELNGNAETGYIQEHPPAQIHHEYEKEKTKFVIFHETGHCILYRLDSVFLTNHHINSSTLNDYFVFSEIDKKSSSLYYILHENFADAYALIKTIKTKINHKTIQEILNTRISLAQKNSENRTFSPPVFEKLLSSEGQEAIKNAKTEQEIINLSLKIANESIFENISHNDLRKYTHIDYAKGSILYYLEAISSQQKKESQHLKKTEIIATQILNEIKKKYYVKNNNDITYILSSQKKEIDTLMLHQLTLHDFPNLKNN